MAPFQGAGAGQAIEVSQSVHGPRRVKSLREYLLYGSLGRFNPRLTSLA